MVSLKAVEGFVLILINSFTIETLSVNGFIIAKVQIRA